MRRDTKYGIDSHGARSSLNKSPWGWILLVYSVQLLDTLIKSMWSLQVQFYCLHVFTNVTPSKELKQFWWGHEFPRLCLVIFYMYLWRGAHSISIWNGPFADYGNFCDAENSDGIADWHFTMENVYNMAHAEYIKLDTQLGSNSAIDSAENNAIDSAEKEERYEAIWLALLCNLWWTNSVITIEINECNWNENKKTELAVWEWQLE